MSIITETLGDIRLDEPLAHRTLTLFPLIRAVDGPPDYLTLDQAMAGSSVKVEEVSESGHVPEIRFENTGDKATLLVDGEEIIGGMQNRILNLSILVPAYATVTIPVSCVEAGRWGRRGSVDHRNRDRILRSKRREQQFRESEHIAFMKMRRAKHLAVSANMRAVGGRRSSQAEVWSEIEDLNYDLGTESPTRAMWNSYEQRRQSLDEFVQALPATKGQIGAVFALNNRIVGFDLFDHPQTLSRLLPKLIRSHAMDALRESENVAAVTSKDAAQDFMNSVSNATPTSYPAIGEGADVRLETKEIAGGGLEARGRLIHLCAFAEEDNRDTPRKRYSRAWTRRQAPRRTG